MYFPSLFFLAERSHVILEFSHWKCSVCTYSILRSSLNMHNQNYVQCFKGVLIGALCSGTHTALPLLEIFLPVLPRLLSAWWVSVYIYIERYTYNYIYLCLYLYLYLYLSRYISINLFMYVCNIRIDTSHMVLQHLYLWTTRQTACSCFSIDLPQQSLREKKPALWPLYTFRTRFVDKFRPPSSWTDLVQMPWGFHKPEFTWCLIPTVPMSPSAGISKEALSTPASSPLLEKAQRPRASCTILEVPTSSP